MFLMHIYHEVSSHWNLIIILSVYLLIALLCELSNVIDTSNLSWMCFTDISQSVVYGIFVAKILILMKFKLLKFSHYILRLVSSPKRHANIDFYYLLRKFYCLSLIYFKKCLITSCLIKAERFMGEGDVLSQSSI